MTLGKRLKELRILKGLTTREASLKLQLGKSTISNYENDARKPDYDMLKKLADLYGVTVAYLLGEEEIKDELAGADIPQQLLDLGVEYIPSMKKLKDNNIPKEVVDKMIEAIIAMNSKNK